MPTETDPSFTLKELGMEKCTEEDLKLHHALAMDPFLRCIGQPYWLGKSKEEILAWIEKNNVRAVAWACTKPFVAITKD